MSNMSYCRFHNTLSDLRDCEQALEHPDDTLSSEEGLAAIKLVEACFRIVRSFSKQEITIPPRSEIKDELDGMVTEWEDDDDD